MSADDAEALQQRLHQHDEWKHLTVTARGKTLVIVAEDGPDDPLVRLESVGAGQYGSSIMWHDDRWQRLPVTGNLDELVALLRTEYASLLAAV
jgi:hypothetical protein